eukprot:scaffold103670_cov18-Tisochrysis_lutea.AAC.4
MYCLTVSLNHLASCFLSSQPCFPQAIGEPLDCKYYNTWNVLVPEGTFLTQGGKTSAAHACHDMRAKACFIACVEALLH